MRYLRKPMSPRVVAAWLVATLVVVAAAIAFCVQGFGAKEAAASDLRADITLQKEAGGIIADVFSVDSRSWSNDRRTAKALVAPPLSVSASEALDGPPPAGTTSVNWVPEQVAVSWADDTAGEVLAVVRVTVTERGGQIQSRMKSVQASFVRPDGRWLLSGLEELQ